MSRAITKLSRANFRLARLGWLGALAALAAVAATPSYAAGTALDCSGSTIYSANRPSSQGSGTHGTIFALSVSTVSGATAAMTEVTAMPGDSYPNALGVSSNGLFAVDQSG
jgi:hypothetical protein